MMDVLKGFMLLCLMACIKCDCNTNVCDIDDQTMEDQHNRMIHTNESQISGQIITLLEHYKQTDPIGVPGDFVADPFPMPDSEQSMGFMGSTLATTDALAYGLSNFRIKNIVFDLTHLMIKAEIEFDEVRIVGNYKLSALFSSTSGPFYVKLTHIVATGNLSVGVERDGKIRTQNIVMDMNFDNLTMNFQNLGMVGKFFQSIINDSPNSVFDSMKPYMLKDAYSKMRADINEKINNWMGKRVLPNSISPLDLALGLARQRVREMGFDPWILPNYNYTINAIGTTISLRDTCIGGMSLFYRIGNVNFDLQNNTLSAGLSLSTQKIMGTTNWVVSAARGIITRNGHIKFDVEFITGTANLSQTLDTRNHPQINDFQLEIGNIQVRSDGAGTFDYVIELLINVLPNLLRYQIMDAIEGPIQAKIQNELNSINVEKLIRSKIPDIEQMSKQPRANLDRFEL